MVALSRGVELLIALYLIAHVFVTVLYDAQAILPAEWYSDSLRATNAKYVEKYHDPLMTPPFATWFHSLIWLEVLVQFPYFLLGAYAFVARKNWIRIPSIIYATTVLTTMLPIYAELHAHRDPEFARTTVYAIYAPFILFPLLILIKTIPDAPFARRWQGGAMLDGGLRAKYGARKER